MGSYLSIITLNVNGLNASTKRQRLAEWIQKQDPSIGCLQDASHFFKASKIFLQYLVASSRKIIPLVPQFPIFRRKEKLLQKTTSKFL